MDSRPDPSPLYGPVVSRRYGVVYGVNLLSASKKSCSWSCVYCQLGTTDRRAGHPDSADPSALRARLEATELQCTPSALVVCGSGEPTTHPRLDDALAALTEFRDDKLPGVPVVLLTNGGELHKSEVRQALRRVDEVSVKLDAGLCETLHKLNQPTGPACVYHQARMIRKLHGAAVQSCFLTGALTNTSEPEVEAWLAALRFAMPNRVDCYTITRATACNRLEAVPERWLASLAARVEGELGIHARAFGASGLIAECGSAREREALRE